MKKLGCKVGLHAWEPVTTRRIVRGTVIPVAWPPGWHEAGRVDYDLEVGRKCSRCGREEMNRPKEAAG